MAKASKQDKQVTLNLSADEAATLLYVVGFGKPGSERNNHLGSIYGALSDAHVEDLYDEHKEALWADNVPLLDLK